MDLSLSAEDREFRDEVRDFLAASLPPDLKVAGGLSTGGMLDPAISLRWQRILFEKGWVAPTWPAEYGGPGWTEVQRSIWFSECASFGAPTLSPLGLRQVGPAIIGHGTPEQKAHYLPRILSGKDYWCQGYSEPGAGSDLASLQTRAVPDGDHYVVTGTKIWTTHAHFANRMYCLVRTSNEGKPQNGITFLLMDMDTPGISIRPIITLAGEHEVNQVFLDGVRVPQSQRLGAENHGWSVAKYLLVFERTGSWSAALKYDLRRLREIASSELDGRGQPLLLDPLFAAKLTEVEVRADVIEMAEHRVLSALVSGVDPGGAASMLKVQGTEAAQLIDELSIEAIGYSSSQFVHVRADRGANNALVASGPSSTAMPRYLNRRAGSIYGGTNEIQRDIIARSVLKL